MRWLLALGLAGFVFASPSSVRAEVVLTWQAPPACSDQASFERAFERAMGTPLRDFGAQPTQVSVVFTETAHGWSVRIAAQGVGASTTRELSTQARACRRLDEGVLVVVGLLVDEVGHAPVPHAVELPPEPASPEPTPPATPRPLPEPPGLRGAFTAGVAGRVDALPGLALGPRFAAEVHLLPALRLGLGIELYPESSSLSSDGTGASLQALAPQASLCGIASLETWIELGGCAGLSVVLLEARGVGLDEARTARGLELDVLVEGRVDVALAPWLSVQLRAGLGVAPVRARVFFREGEVERLLHVTSLVFPMASLSLEVQLGS